jgi:hypothetical protein
MRINYSKHNAWVAARIAEMRDAVAANAQQRVQEIANILLVRIPNHGEGSDGFGTNETDLRYHLHHLNSYLYGDGDTREGIANFQARKEDLVANLNDKLRNENRNIARGKGDEIRRDNLSQDIHKLNELVESVRDKVYPVMTVYSILEKEAQERGIQPRQVETAPDMRTTAIPVVGV